MDNNVPDEMTEEQANDIFEKLKSSPAVLSKDEIYTHEKSCQERDMWRRAAFASLGLSGDELIKKIETDRDCAKTFADVLNTLKTYRDHLDGVKEVILTAEARLMVALCVREDMQAIFEELEANA